jgi:hypothetical protein
MYFSVTFVALGELTVLFSCLHAPYLWPPSSDGFVMEKATLPRLPQRVGVTILARILPGDPEKDTAHLMSGKAVTLECTDRTKLWLASGRERLSAQYNFHHVIEPRVSKVCACVSCSCPHQMYDFMWL